eukprot:174427_1
MPFTTDSHPHRHCHTSLIHCIHWLLSQPYSWRLFALLSSQFWTICLIIITILEIICLINITILETILPQHYPYHCQDIGDYPIIAVAAAAVTIMGINTFVPHSDHQITIPWRITLNLMDLNTFVPHSDHRITALWIITSYHIIIHFFAPSAKPFTHPYTFITNLSICLVICVLLQCPAVGPQWSNLPSVSAVGPQESDLPPFSAVEPQEFDLPPLLAFGQQLSELPQLILVFALFIFLHKDSYWTRYARKNQKSYCNTIYGIKYPLFVFAFSVATLTYPNVCTCYFYNFIKVMCVDLVYHHSLTPP